ncbi:MULTISPECIES: hypothetical protein [unclassified Variovorax]|uniref:hypothetical protein n=1 Tax=unclassified Variovorax TaxID=663243 RepID=UPI000B876960|nr:MULTISPECIES: hypothetical protein [unclassified Variovorax]
MKKHLLTMQILLAGLLSMASMVQANSFRAPLAEMAEASDVVALVEIVEGALFYGDEGYRCGARYAARVERSLKGTSDGDVITFGRFSGQAIGSRYFVFLKKGEIGLSTPMGPAMEKHNIDFMRLCPAHIPALGAVYQGLGIVPVTYGKLASYRPVVRLTNAPYEIPARLKAFREPGGSEVDGIFYGTVEAEINDFFNFLKSELANEK